jgi:hypothetical protein
MPTIFVQLTSGTAPGPYTVYANSLNSSPIEQNISAASLRAGIQYVLPDPTPTKIIVTNSNPACNNNYVEVFPIEPSPTPTATPTSTPTGTSGVTPTPTATPTPTPGTSQTPTPTPTTSVTATATPIATQTQTPTLTSTPSSKPLVTVTVNLTIDAGNTGYTQVYYPLTDGGSLGLRQTLTTSGTTSFTIFSGNYFYVATVQQSRVFPSQVSEIIFKINGTPDAASPYIQTNLNSPIVLQNVPLYGVSGYPSGSFGNTYVVDTYIGNPR